MKFYRGRRNTYWSDAKIFARFLPKEEHVGYRNIDEMMERLNRKKPLLETIIDKTQNFVMFPMDLAHSVRIYFKNVKGKTHILDGGLEKGVWYDLDYRISQCLFHELEKYIEKEKGLEAHAWEQSLVWDENTWIDKDDERFGLPTPQALAAQEQEVIYQWWKKNKNSADDFLKEELFQEEEEMLIRLIKIRRSLWT